MKKKIVAIFFFVLTTVSALVLFLLFFFKPGGIANSTTISRNESNSIVFKVNEKSKARAIQLSVGQADCGLIQVSQDDSFKSKKDNFDILVDTGVELSGKNKAKQELISKLSSYDVGNIELIVFSHFHYDHIGGAQSILSSNKFSFENTLVLYNFAEIEHFRDKLSKTAKELLEKIKKMKLQEIDSDTWARKDDNKLVKFMDLKNKEKGFFSVVGGINEPLSKSNPNAWSVVNKMQWGNKSILYTGDLAGKNKEDKINPMILEKHYDELDCDILKAPHHGSVSENSNNLELLELIKPKQIWISVGNSNKYALPRIDALKRFLLALKNKDASFIKGTSYFGGDIEKQAIWKDLQEWIKEHPTINNSNKGHGDILYEFN